MPWRMVWEDEPDPVPGWLERTRDWYHEWRPFSGLPDPHLWAWAFIAAVPWARHPRRLWHWWVDEYMAALVYRRRIQRRLDSMN